MESRRKRRVSEICADGQARKRVDRRVKDSKHEFLPVNALAAELSEKNSCQIEILKSGRMMIQSLAPPTVLPLSAALTRAHLVTPRNSFLELRPMSSSLNMDDDMEQHESVSSRSSSSYASDSSIIRDSPTFQISLEHEVEPSPIFAALNPKQNVVPRRVVLQDNINVSYSLLSPRMHSERRRSMKTLILMAVIYVGMRFLASMVLESVVIEDENSIYVPGGGFSGFWYTLGRLNSIEDPLSKKYYCYSAGCLGAVTMLGNITMESAHAYAVDAQTRWSQGYLSRYDVTTSFVDNLLYGSDVKEAVTPENLRPAFRDERILSTLQIITSKRNDNGGVKVAIRTPMNADELKEMLLQTTWIPFAINRDLWHEEHMDGAFTLIEHPWCTTKLGYGFDWDLILNSLNVNLAKDKAKLLWQKGFSKGA